MIWLFQECSKGSNAGVAVLYQLSLEITQKQGKLLSPKKSSTIDVKFVVLLRQLSTVLMHTYRTPESEEPVAIDESFWASL